MSDHGLMPLPVGGPDAVPAVALPGVRRRTRGGRPLSVVLPGAPQRGDGGDERGGSAFDTPSLLGLHDTAPYFHDGSAETLQILLTMNDPMGVHGIEALTTQDITDLAAFLSSLP